MLDEQEVRLILDVLKRRLEAAKAEGKPTALVSALEDRIEELENGRVRMASGESRREAVRDCGPDS
jgi:hypothetical protein